MSVSCFRNGDTIYQARSNADWIYAGRNCIPAWTYYDDNTSLGKKYGKLYNWYAVSDSHGLAPEVYHIPTKQEWEILVLEQGGYNTAARSLKSRCCWRRDSPNEAGGGTNECGFNALPGGYRDGYSASWTIGEEAYFWTSSEFDKDTAWAIGMNYWNNGLTLCKISKAVGLSVRVIKN